MSEIRNLIRTGLESGRVVFGMRESVKAVRSKKARQVVFSSSCPAGVKEKITRIPGAEASVFDGDSTEMGIFCGKPFSIAVLCIKEEDAKPIERKRAEVES